MFDWYIMYILVLKSMVLAERMQFTEAHLGESQ